MQTFTIGVLLGILVVALFAIARLLDQRDSAERRAAAWRAECVALQRERQSCWAPIGELNKIHREHNALASAVADLVSCRKGTT